jgi:putative ABC transport system permease protein
VRTSDYAKIAFKDLWRQKIRTGLTLFALIISTVILVIMAAISIGGQQVIVDQFGSDEALTVISVTPNQSNAALSPFGDVQEVNTNATKLDDAAVTKLAAIPNVKTASPRAHIWEFNSFSIENSDKQLVAQTEGVASNAKISLKSGVLFNSNDDKGAVIIGYAYAKALGYGDAPELLINKTINITTQKGYRGTQAIIPLPGSSKQVSEAFGQSTTIIPAKIIGVTDSGPNQNSLFVSLGWAHAIRSAQYYENNTLKTTDSIEKDGYSTVQMNVNDVDNVKSVSTAIERLGYGQISTLAQIERLQQFSATMWLILGAVAIIAIIAAALGVVNTMLMAVSDQQYAIGVWRAVGARKGTIVKLFLVQAAFLGSIGGAAGSVLGLFVSQFVNQYVNSIFKSQGLALADIAVVPVWLVVGTILLTTFFGILAGLYPAYRAARQDPSKILSGAQ